jgi:2-polyprenyl-6-methoxyphenol hydroxylase-like FAD-dependent oxidoreductase
MKLVVVGAGLAGLSTAIACGRRGHEVLVLERDEHDSPPPAEAFTEWHRTGVGHFRQPHTFLALARKTLREEAPDILDQLFGAGATEYDQRALIPGGSSQPGDDELANVLCRRPVFEAVLRSVAVATPGVHIEPGAVTDGLVTRQSGRTLAVEGVRRRDDTIPADMVIDASGRNSKVRTWLVDAGAELAEREQFDCGIVYFSRFFALRDGAERPPGAHVFGGPRGDLGYLAFAIMVGDNRTFAVVLVTRPDDEPFKALRHDAAWMAVAQSIPAIADWVDPARAEPITSVQFNGRVNNTIQPLHAAPGSLRGIQSIGDALSHVNPTIALGAAVSLEQGFSFGNLVAKLDDVGEIGEAFEAERMPACRTRFEAVCAEDRERLRWWNGEVSDPLDPTQSLALAIRSAVYPAATRDPELFRAVARRMGALDPMDQLVNNRELVDRALSIFQTMRDEGKAPPVGEPRREVLLDALATANQPAGS